MTKIEWADMTINPVVGCSHCSPGCDNCYAERFAARLAKNPKTAEKYKGVVDENGKWTGKINSNFSEKMYPHRVPGKRKKVFVGSMTDIFHPNYPADNRDEIFASILADHIFTNGHGHTFIILTKRPQAMAKYFAAGPDTLLRRWGRAGNGWIIVGDGDSETFEEYADGQTIPQEMTSPRDNLRQDYLWPLPNVWLGVTVCNQAEADAKIPVLLQTPAAVRFVSVEPCLGPVDLGEYLGGQNVIQQGGRIRISSSSNGRVGDRFFGTNLENCVSQGEPMDGRDDNNPLPETASRKELREIPASSGYGQQETRKCIGSSFGVAAFQRTNTGRHDDKSQKWESEGQQARELRTRHIFGTNSSFIPCPKIASQKRLDGALCWVICGGETGPGARPMHPDWVRSLRDQCQAAGTPFFFKSWGEWWPGEWGRLYREKTISYADGQDMVLIGKRRAGRLLDGVEHNEFPEVKA